MIGIDVSDRSIKVAEVERGDQPELHSLCWTSLQPGAIQRGTIQNVQLVVAGIRQAFLSCSPRAIEGREVVASIPELRSFVRAIDLPIMSEGETDEAVHWAVRQHIPFDLDRVYVDWQRLSGTGIPEGRQQVLVGVTQRDVVDPLLMALEGADLQVVALELEAQAIIRSLLPLNRAGVEGVLIIDLGATSTNVIFVDEGAMRYTASIQIGGDNLTNELAEALHIQPSIAAEKKATIGLLENEDQEVAKALRRATLDLVQRIERVVKEIGAQISQRGTVRAIILAGGAANLPGISTVFSDIFPNTPVQVGNPLINIAIRRNASAAVSQEDASHFATALGLALRPLETL